MKNNATNKAAGDVPIKTSLLTSNHTSSLVLQFYVNNLHHTKVERNAK